MPIKVLMPALSPTMVEGNLVKWNKKEGDAVKAGDVLAEIETDKATMEVEAVDEGVLGKIFVDAGTTAVKVNTLIAALLEEGEDKSALDSLSADVVAPKVSSAAATPTAANKDVPAASAAPVVAVSSAASSSVSVAQGGRVFASPLAKRIAQQKGLDLRVIKGSGPGGRIIKADVEKAPQSTSNAGGLLSAAPLPTFGIETPFDLVPHTMMRKVIAERLTQSKQTVPHFYLSVDVEIDELLRLRKSINARQDVKVSVNDFIIRATALALKKVPDANASWSDQGVMRYSRSDISVAVAIPGGLITPILRGAEMKSLIQLSSEMKGLAERAKAGKLMPEEYQGGTFSISNLGMFGIKKFEAIINPPQACILAVGAGEERAVVKDGAIVIANVMTCSLSVDHRVVDGAVGAQFLSVFKELLQDPLGLIL